MSVHDLYNTNYTPETFQANLNLLEQEQLRLTNTFNNRENSFKVNPPIAQNQKIQLEGLNQLEIQQFVNEYAEETEEGKKEFEQYKKLTDELTKSALIHKNKKQHPELQQIEDINKNFSIFQEEQKKTNEILASTLIKLTDTINTLKNNNHNSTKVSKKAKQNKIKVLLKDNKETKNEE